MTGKGEIAAAGALSPAACVVPPGWRNRRDRPIYTVALWPSQTLGPRGRKWVMGIAALGLALPLGPLLSTPAFWGLLPFLLLALAALWFGFHYNNKALRISERLCLWRDEIRIIRVDPGGHTRFWQADPAEVRVQVYQDAKVENYLTLRGAGREIELGAFLSPEERLELADQIRDALARAWRG